MGERSIWNYYAFEDGGKEKKAPLPPKDVGDRLLQLVDPIVLRRVSGELFAVDHPGRAYNRIKDATELFGWVQSRLINVYWSNTTPGCITKSEFFSFLRLLVPDRTSIRMLPHEPRLQGVEYLCDQELGREYSGALDELVDFWKPKTEHDRTLMKAAFCTPFWGGPGGARPAISIESDGTDHGRGIGKSQLMYAIARVAGGHIDCSLKDDIATVKKRLLTEGTTVSVVGFDNCKTSKISSADLEGMITAPTVSGWRPHHGNAEIPNHLTYIFTMNDANFSTDMSSRSVRIFLCRQPKDSGWQTRLDSFIERCREDVIGDIIFSLRAEPRKQAKYIRFAKWQYEVLSRIDGGDDIAAVLEQRQEEVDGDAEAAADLSGAIQHRIAEYRRPGGTGQWETVPCDPEKDSFLIARDVACDWIRSRLDRQATNTAITRQLRRSKIPNLVDASDMHHGVRYWRWLASPTLTPRACWRIHSLDTRQPLKEHVFRQDQEQKKCSQDVGAEVRYITQAAPVTKSNDSA